MSFFWFEGNVDVVFEFHVADGHVSGKLLGIVGLDVALLLVDGNVDVDRLLTRLLFRATFWHHVACENSMLLLDHASFFHREDSIVGGSLLLLVAMWCHT